MERRFCKSALLSEAWFLWGYKRLGEIGATMGYLGDSQRASRLVLGGGIGANVEKWGDNYERGKEELERIRERGGGNSENT